MNRIVSVLLFLMVSITGMSQTQQEYNIYTRDKFLFNPAQTGEVFGLKAFFNYRRKWTGFEGAPEQTTFALDYRSTDKVGLGATISNFKYGLLSDFTVQMGYSYRVQVAKDQFLRLGVTGGFLSQQLDVNRVKVSNPQDPVLMNDEMNTIRFRGGLGAAYHWKNLNVDLALPSVVDGSNLYGDIYALASYDFPLQSSHLMIQPSALYRTIPGSDDLGHFAVAGEWQKMLWAQFGYALNDEFVMAFAVNHKGMEIGYSYGMATGDLRHVSEGNHEIRLAYNFGHNKGKGWKPSFRSQTRKAQVAALKKNLEESQKREKESQEHLASLKEELSKIKEELSAELESIKQSVVNLKEDEMEIPEEETSKGYYVIVYSFKKREHAQRGQKLLNEKGVQTHVIENKTKGYTYLYTSQFDNLSEALSNMKKERNKGFTDAWVLVL